MNSVLQLNNNKSDTYCNIKVFVKELDILQHKKSSIIKYAYINIDMMNYLNGIFKKYFDCYYDSIKCIVRKTDILDRVIIIIFVCSVLSQSAYEFSIKISGQTIYIFNNINSNLIMIIEFKLKSYYMYCSDIIYGNRHITLADNVILHCVPYDTSVKIFNLIKYKIYLLWMTSDYASHNLMKNIPQDVSRYIISSFL